MASLTRSDVISPFSARLSIKASFEAPELRQAMLMCLAAGRAVYACFVPLLSKLVGLIAWKSFGTEAAATMTRAAARVRKRVLKLRDGRVVEDNGA